MSYLFTVTFFTWMCIVGYIISILLLVIGVFFSNKKERGDFLNLSVWFFIIASVTAIMETKLLDFLIK